MNGTVSIDTVCRVEFHLQTQTKTKMQSFDVRQAER